MKLFTAVDSDYKDHFHVVEIDDGNGLTTSTKGSNIPEHSHRVINNTVFASIENHVHKIVERGSYEKGNTAIRQNQQR